MARMRSVKPEFWTDRKLARISRDARLLYIALWNQADEWARVHGDTRYVKGHCLPYDDDLSLTAVDRLLDELDDAGHVQRYEAEGDPYLFLPKLAKHQRLEPAKVPSRLPEPPKPGTRKSAPRANESARRSDEMRADPVPSGVRNSAEADVSAGQGTWSEPRADVLEPDANSSGTIVALHVAGSRWHEAGSREQVHGPRGAQALVAEYIDSMRKRPPQPVVGQVAKLVGQMLAEGIDYDDVRTGLFAWAGKGMHPATLPSVVNEVMNAGSVARPATGRVAEGDAILREAFERGQRQRELEAGA